MGESEQIEMNKNVFWELIAQAKAQYGQDMGAAESWLTDELVKRGPRAAQSFHDIIHAYPRQGVGEIQPYPALLRY